GLPDYNGHHGVRELCDICPVAQIRRSQSLIHIKKKKGAGAGAATAAGQAFRARPAAVRIA
ncbi:hypothetical protein, partial [Frankia sp. AgB1.8]|uniref:hypothetical protein n=1 Tax=Frankia sp. AgB1.8 TaxID=2792839 RepID=UPI001EE3D2EC